MTPADKAKYLVDRYCPGIWENMPEERDGLIDAKECAIIVVEEIIKDKNDCGCEQSIVIGKKYQTYHTYWEDVKKCIEAL